MLDEAAFGGLIDEIVSLGYDRETAGRWAVLIGDTPVLDRDGFVMVMDDQGQVLARLRLELFNKS